MKTYKIVVAYQGTQYAGWQMQQHVSAVANILQNAFFKIFKKNITLLGASRTDAGVHAYGQTATFSVDLTVPTAKMMFAWNNILPDDILIRSLEEITFPFHPRFDVAQKTYWYHFFLEAPLPPFNHWGYHIKKPFDFEKLDQALQLFVGKHDFRAFASDVTGKSSIRIIDNITRDFNEQLQAHRIIVQGKSFLHCMIRRIVGASFEVALNRTDYATMKHIFDTKNPNHALPNAPAHGLMLYEIKYKDKK